MSIVLLTTCNTSVEANLLKGMLKNNGISCFLANENFSNLMPHYNGIMGSGVQIMIDETDKEKALGLLEEQQKDVRILCPHCNSANVTYGLGKRKIGKYVAILLSLFLMIPFGNLRNTFYCRDCKTEFKVSN
jgi:hypothetical protein